MSQPSLGRTTSGRRRRFWFDPRFAIGMLLVAVSVGGVVAIVSATDSTVQVMAARSAISPGDQLDTEDLVAVAVKMPATVHLYLPPAEMPADGFVATRSIDAGELVPLSAVGSTSGLQLASIVLSLTNPLPHSVEPGTRLDVWSSREGETGEYAAPTVIVASAIVVRLVESEGLMSSGPGVSVEVLVPRFAVARVLEGIANGAALSAVPVDLPLGD